MDNMNAIHSILFIPMISLYILLDQIKTGRIHAALLQIVSQKACPLAGRMVDQELSGRYMLYHPHQSPKVQMVAELDGGVMTIPSPG